MRWYAEFIILASIKPNKANNVDLTLIPGKIGGDVSRAVHDKLVAKLNINDRGFIINYAFVETEFGKNVSFSGKKRNFNFN